MCGIAGIFVPDDRTPDRSQAQLMIDRLAHRGPDRRAVHVERHVALAAARLSIVDLSPAGDQPLHDASGDLTIVFNGEVYNFKELCATLESKGHRFRSHSDTEVVLAAYREWGTDCHQYFNGMWAFAIWDRRNRRLLLSRDRFGVKPLYTATLGRTVVFGSEIKALLAAGVPASLDPSAFNNYCGGESMFAGVDAVAPGSFVEYTVDSAPVRRTWWRTADHLVDVPRRFADRVAKFDELLRDAVRVRLRTDVAPVVTLSGGLDSSSIYAECQALYREGRARSATHELPVDPQAFTVSFPGSAVDETHFASRVMEHFGRSTEQIRVTPDDFRRLVQHVTWHQEALVWNSSVLVYHEFYRQLAARGTRVVLEGHGGDELLAGYHVFADDAVRQRVRSLRMFSAWSAARAAARTRNPVLEHFGGSAMRTLAGAVVHALRPARRVVPAEGTRSVFARELLVTAEPTPFVTEIPGLSPLKSTLYAAFHTRVLPTILRVNDRATMAYGVESRSPFLDYRLVCFAFSLRDSDLLGRGWTKRILREAMQPLLPAEIVWREKKLPFIGPQLEWFANPVVTTALKEAIVDGTLARAPGVDVQAFEQTLSRGITRGFGWRDSIQLWTAYSYAMWQDLFRFSSGASEVA